MPSDSFVRCGLWIAFLSALEPAAAPAMPGTAAEARAGSLQAGTREGKPLGTCPLEHTEVLGEISGILSRVTVAQKFRNPFPEPIEAVYTFPLPHEAAVDDMTIRVGDRLTRSVIGRREEAREAYERARAQGRLAALLDQERPNIFTQSVANIAPGQRVEISISYVEVLKYEDGSYRFVFPVVVGPRYHPGSPGGYQGGGRSPDTGQLSYIRRVTPPVAGGGTLAGHDLSIKVEIDSGVPFANLRSTNHEIVVLQNDHHSATVRLLDKAVIPNRDFILTYDVAGPELQDGLVTHKSGADGYFMLLLQPPARVTPSQAAPKELVFVLDTSGSMSGLPIEKAKTTIWMALDGLYADDTFNLITFSGNTEVLFPEPVPATPANLARAREFMASQSGRGGTEMMQAIRAALAPSGSTGRVRIVCFMTDGLVGNDMEIISEVRRHPNARVFAFGVGSSVNRFLLDRMASEGRGAVEYVALMDDDTVVARRFHERIRNPLLTDITIDWAGLPVKEVYPQRIPDVFSAQPVTVCGRYTGGGAVLVRLKGRQNGRPVVREIEAPFPELAPRHGVLARLWARQRIEAVMALDYAGMQRGTPLPEVREEMTRLGLEHRLATQFTSFLAVEERVVSEGGITRRIEVPVEMPEGMSHDGVFGPAGGSPVGVAGVVGGFTGGVVGGIAGSLPGGVVGGVLGGVPPPPPPPLPVRREPSVIAPIRVGGRVQESKLVRKVEPVYPTLARQTRFGCALLIEAAIDERGNVESARVLRGHELLNEAALQAVRQWKYTPTLLNGTPVKVIATLVITFDNRGRGKLDPAVALLIRRLQAGGAPDAPEAEFVRGGIAALELTLSEPKPSGRALNALGFIITSRSDDGRKLTGRMPMAKLEALLSLAGVAFVAPYRSR